MAPKKRVKTGKAATRKSIASQPHVQDGNSGGRERLIHAALKLFAEDGYDGTSVRALAAEAGVSFGLIRKYFGSKEGLRDTVEEYVIQEVERFYARSLPMGDRSPDVAAEGAVEFLEQDRDVLLYLRFALLHPQKGTQKLFKRYFEMYQNIMNSLEQAGQLTEGMDSRWGAFLLMFMQLGPLIIEPFAEQILGDSIYSPELLRARQRAYIAMLTKPLLRS